MSYVTSYHHIVFATHLRQNSITESNKRLLYRYIAGIIDKFKFKSQLIWINGTENHVHILLNLHPKVALADLVGAIKSRSNLWIKESGLFPRFDKWCNEYYAGSLAHGDVSDVKAYIQGQELHHYGVSYDEEIEKLVRDMGMSLYRDEDGNADL